MCPPRMNSGGTLSFAARVSGLILRHSNNRAALSTKYTLEYMIHSITYKRLKSVQRVARLSLYAVHIIFV